MKEEFDFNKVEKRTPYSVPENFFETNAQRIIEEANRQKKSQGFNRRAILFALTTAASIALILSVYLFVNKSNNSASVIAENSIEVKTTPTPVLMDESVSDSIIVPQKKVNISKAPMHTESKTTVDKAKSVDDLIASISDEALEEMVMQIDDDPFYELHNY